MIILGILVRSLVIAFAGWFSAWAVGALTGGQDANIGAGLASMAVTAGASGLWAFLDGRRHGLNRALLIWLLAALLIAVAWPLVIAAMDGELDPDVVLSDLAFVAPFFAAMVGFPAAIGAFIGHSTRG